MTDDTNKYEPEMTEAEEAAIAAEVADIEAPVAEPDPLELAKAETADMRDRYLRLAADMDNLRRRTEREVKDAKSYSVAGFARDMLAVSDNLRRALEAIPAEAREAGDAGFNALIEGVEMTERAMLSALERHGVKKLEPVGQKFDPNFHQAMFEIPNPDRCQQHRRAGRPGRLHDRRARAAPGHGRRRQGRPEGSGCGRNTGGLIIHPPLEGEGRHGSAIGGDPLRVSDVTPTRAFCATSPSRGR